MIEKHINSILPQNINSIDILFLVIILLTISIIIIIVKNNNLKKEIKNIPGYELNSKVIEEIESIKEDLLSKTSTNLKFNSEIKKLVEKTQDILYIENIKYNPYKDMGVGGNQSFSTALINKNGDGIILTNLYSRERTRVMLKEIKNFIPTKELTPEEKEVLEKLKK